MNAPDEPEQHTMHSAVNEDDDCKRKVKKARVSRITQGVKASIRMKRATSVPNNNTAEPVTGRIVMRPRSCSSQKRPQKPRRRVATVAQRRAANIRERRRMFNLNSAFDRLRKRVPSFAYEKRLSRIETLKLAIMYIKFMDNLVNDDDCAEKYKQLIANTSIAEARSGYLTSGAYLSLYGPSESAAEDVAEVSSNQITANAIFSRSPDSNGRNRTNQPQSDQHSAGLQQRAGNSILLSSPPTNCCAPSPSTSSNSTVICKSSCSPSSVRSPKVRVSTPLAGQQQTVAGAAPSSCSSSSSCSSPSPSNRADGHTYHQPPYQSHHQFARQQSHQQQQQHYNQSSAYASDCSSSHVAYFSDQPVPLTYYNAANSGSTSIDQQPRGKLSYYEQPPQSLKMKQNSRSACAVRQSSYTPSGLYNPTEESQPPPAYSDHYGIRSHANSYQSCCPIAAAYPAHNPNQSAYQHQHQSHHHQTTTAAAAAAAHHLAAPVIQAPPSPYSLHSLEAR